MFNFNSLNKLDPKNEVVLVKQVSQEIQDLHFKMIASTVEEVKKGLQAELTKSCEDVNALYIAQGEAIIAKEEFWMAVRKKYPTETYRYSQIGIREDFQLVGKKKDDEDHENCEDCGGDHGKIIQEILKGKINAIKLSDLIKMLKPKKEGDDENISN